MTENIRNNEAFSPAGCIEYVPGSVVSRQVIKNKSGNITLFAFDKGEELSEHTAPFDAVVHVLEGELSIRIGGKENILVSGKAIIMAAGIPHALRANSKAKFYLVMIKGEG